MGRGERAVHRLVTPRPRNHAERGIDVGNLDVGERHVVVDEDRLALRGGRHAVVRHDHDVRASDQAAGAEALDQAADLRVGADDLIAHLRRVGPVPVAHPVHLVEIERHERRALSGRQIEPREHLVHSRRGRHRLVELAPIARLHAADLGLGARPEHRGGDQALALHGVPDRLAAPPHRIGHGLAVGAAKDPPGRRVADDVGDHAVVPGKEAGRHAVVAGDGLRGIAGNQRLGAHAARDERPQVRRRRLRVVVPAPAVDRDQDGERSLSGPRLRQKQARARGDAGEQQNEQNAA